MKIYGRELQKKKILTNNVRYAALLSAFNRLRRLPRGVSTFRAHSFIHTAREMESCYVYARDMSHDALWNCVCCQREDLFLFSKITQSVNWDDGKKRKDHFIFFIFLFVFNCRIFYVCVHSHSNFVEYFAYYLRVLRSGGNGLSFICINSMCGTTANEAVTTERSGERNIVRQFV